MPNSPKVESPEWWVERLYTQLIERQSRLRKFERYYHGELLPADLPSVPRDLRAEFMRMWEASQSNMMGMVVDAVADRLGVIGLSPSSEDDPELERHAWELWQASDMDMWSGVAFVEALVKEQSYLSVWRDSPGAKPRIAVEDPLEAIVEHVPGDPRQRAAGLKAWTDDWTGTTHATLYLPGGLYKFETGSETSPTWSKRVIRNARGRQESWPLPNPLGEVPLVPLVNRPDLRMRGRSEIAQVMHAQDRINKTIWDRMIASEYGAFPHRWALGVDADDPEDEDDEDEPKSRVARFDHLMNRIWTNEAGPSDAGFGQFTQLQLKPFIDAIEQDVLHIAYVTRTPRHYLIQQGQSPSGDALRSAETGLVAKTKGKQGPFGEGVETALRLALRLEGVVVPPDSETVWRDPEYQTPSQLTDAVVKQVEAGLITRWFALQRLGWTPQQIRKMDAQQAGDDLLRFLRSGKADEEPEEPEEPA
jgi:hypothetical protein